MIILSKQNYTYILSYKNRKKTSILLKFVKINVKALTNSKKIYIMYALQEEVIHFSPYLCGKRLYINSIYNIVLLLKVDKIDL